MNDIYWLGVDGEYIRLCDITKPYVKGEIFLLEILVRFLNSLKKCNMRSEIQKEVSGWIQRLSKGYKDKEQINTKDNAQLTKDSEKWLLWMKIDIAERWIFEVLRSGALNQTALLTTSEGKPSAFFEEKVWNALSEIEKNDFSNSAKCLLVGLPTPAVMVALRGAEATVKRYYKHKTGESAKKKLWGPIIEELKGKSEELKIKPTFLGYLDYIRDAKRNLAEHPNKIYDQRDAELIFMETVNLVQDTYAEMA